MRNILFTLLIAFSLTGCISLKNTKFKLASYSPGEESTTYEFVSKKPRQRFLIVDSCDKFTDFNVDYSIEITPIP